MIETLLHAILAQIEQPKKDLEHNLRAILSEAISRMDLVTQDEIERQKTALNLANQQLTALQAQLKVLESTLDKHK
ncbi:MAG: accessory factor UbiK family protein [Acinetobacter sp.]